MRAASARRALRLCAKPAVSSSSARSARSAHFDSRTIMADWDPKASPYPPARRDDGVIRTYQSARDGEVRIPDPYAWLEEPTEETDRYVEAQQAYTEAFLAKDDGNRGRFRETLRGLFDYARFSAPSLKGDHLCDNADGRTARLKPRSATTAPSTAACKRSRRSIGSARARRARRRRMALKANCSLTPTLSVAAAERVSL